MKLFLYFMSLINIQLAAAQTVLPLYKDSIPNSRPYPDQELVENNNGYIIIQRVSRPTITVYLPPKEKANGTAVIIYPGGGYWVVAAGHEGADVAREFNKIGITAFVVKYRIPYDSTMKNKEIGPLQDAQRAIQFVRENASQWKINKNKIGFMGFSAGGHLASTAGTHFQGSYIANPKKTSLRPDFMILVYPVISFIDTVGHMGSRDQLIGKNPSKEKIKEYSNELQVNSKTPPTFLIHSKDDDVVKVSNATRFQEALEKNKVKNGIFLYDKGGHGYGMNNPTSNEKWMNYVIEWMKKNKFIK